MAANLRQKSKQACTNSNKERSSRTPYITYHLHTYLCIHSPEESWSYSTDDCHSFFDDISIVENVSGHIVIRCDASTSFSVSM